MILVIAPYCPIGSLQSNLGAARKIEAVCSILLGFNKEIILVNTGHDGNVYSWFKWGRIRIGDRKIISLTLPTIPNRTLGKFLNVFFLNRCISILLRRGAPDLVWLYNGYVAESLLGLICFFRSNSKIVMEMEDWHFSRSRGLNPKPLLDYISWSFLRGKCDLVYAVNKEVAKKSASMCKDGSVKLLPGLVDADKFDRIAAVKPFSRIGQMSVGFFGGLSRDKGFDKILDLAGSMPENWRLLVAGSGPMSSAIRDISERNASVHFYGQVSNLELEQLILESDVLINPHVDIESMGNGVFPFKVVEGLASGRLYISTQVPLDGLSPLLGQAMTFFDGTLRDLIDKIQLAPQAYREREEVICRCRAYIRSNFSTLALRETVAELVEN